MKEPEFYECGSRGSSSPRTPRSLPEPDARDEYRLQPPAPSSTAWSTMTRTCLADHLKQPQQKELIFATACSGTGAPSFAAEAGQACCARGLKPSLFMLLGLLLFLAWLLATWRDDSQSTLERKESWESRKERERERERQRETKKDRSRTERERQST